MLFSRMAGAMCLPGHAAAMKVRTRKFAMLEGNESARDPKDLQPSAEAALNEAALLPL